MFYCIEAILSFALLYGILYVGRVIVFHGIIDDALLYGVYDKAGEYNLVERGLYDEYIITHKQSGEKIIVSKTHLIENLKRRTDSRGKNFSHDNSWWKIAYPKDRRMG